ncbi:MAG: Fe-S cluster assembly protein SufD [Pseudomonadota bacterium]
MSLEALRSQSPLGEEVPEWRRSERDATLDALIRDGFPTRRDEAWKYTRSEAFRNFVTEPKSKTAADVKAIAEQARSLIGDQAAGLILLVNGVYCSEESDLPEGIQISARDSAEPTPLAGSEAALARLALALAESDLTLNVAAEVSIENPIHIVHYAGPGQLAQSLMALNAGAGSDIQMIEHFIGEAADTPAMSNVWWRIALSEHANATLHRHQQLPSDALHATRIDATLDTGSKLIAFTLDMGGALVRNDLNARLVGVGADVTMNGLYLTNDHQHVDNHTRVDHIARDTISNEDYRGILRDHSRAVFNGKVVVHEGADGTDSSQSNPNLLLSDNAEIDTKPELEIYADDVKCAHGATVGQLDRTALFYLQSRGVDSAVATQLLTYAFCRETLTHVGDDHTRRLAESLIASQIPEFTVLDIIE